MITAQNGIYKLDTDNTSYIFRECESGHLQHLYYGRKIHADAQVLCEKHVSIPGILIYTVLILIIFHLRICALKCLHGERVI